MQYVPRDIWNSYGPEHRAVVDYIFPFTYRLRQDVVFPAVQIVYFTDCDRGIECWEKFSQWLKRTFPNLRVLFLKQSWTYDCTHNTHNDTEIYAIEAVEIEAFMADPWLETIWISQQNGDQHHASFAQGKIRVFHTNQNKHQKCPGYCRHGQCYNDEMFCCCCHEPLDNINACEAATMIYDDDILLPCR